MMLTRRATFGGAAALAAVASIRRPARAQASRKVLRIGIVNDQSGVYSAIGGPGTVACVKQAIADFAPHNGLEVEVLVGDHQNKPDIAVSIVRQWFADGVDAIMDIQSSAAALALNGIVREQNKVMLATDAGTSALTGPSCSPNTLHFGYDTYMMSKVTGGAMVRNGGESWYILYADYAFGKSMASDVSQIIKDAGGKVLGTAAVPFPNTDFSSYLVQAQASGAKVIGLAEAGGDLVNCIKQAAEFGITQRGQKLAALLMFINDVHALGLKTCQGLVLANSYYWDLDDRSRAFAKRVWAGLGNQPPNMCDAANYAAALHYMRAAHALGVAKVKASGVDAVNWMKAHKIEDGVLNDATIRPDGLVTSTAYLCEVKKPEESKHPWDYYKVLAKVPPADAWRPLADGGCPLAKA